MSERTLRRHLNWLIYNNWVGYDGEYLFVRSWLRIHGYIDFKSKAAVYLDELELVSKQENYIAWATAATIAQAIRWQKHVKYLQERSKGSSLPRRNFHAVSNQLLAKILNCSPRQAIKYKQLSEQYKMIKSKHKLDLIDI
jgi:hypothetical protein